MKSFEDYRKELTMPQLLVSANCCRHAFEAGQQSKQAEVDELWKRIDELEGKNKILGMRLDVIQGVMQKEIDLIIKMKGENHE